MNRFYFGVLSSIAPKRGTKVSLFRASFIAWWITISKPQRLQLFENLVILNLWFWLSLPIFYFLGNL